MSDLLWVSVREDDIPPELLPWQNKPLKQGKKSYFLSEMFDFTNDTISVTERTLTWNEYLPNTKREYMVVI